MFLWWFTKGKRKSGVSGERQGCRSQRGAFAMPATQTYGCRRNGALKNERDDAYPVMGAADSPDTSSGTTSNNPSSCPRTSCGAAWVQLQPKLIQRLKLNYWLCGPSAGRSYLISRGKQKKIPTLLTICTTSLQELLCSSGIRPSRFSKESGVEASFPRLLF